MTTNDAVKAEVARALQEEQTKRLTPATPTGPPPGSWRAQVLAAQQAGARARLRELEERDARDAAESERQAPLVAERAAEVAAINARITLEELRHRDALADLCAERKRLNDAPLEPKRRTR